MPLPLVAAVPVAALVTMAGIRAFRRATTTGWRDQRAEDALDVLPEGVTLRADESGKSGTLHVHRVFQWGSGAKYEFDLAVFGRIRLKRL